MERPQTTPSPTPYRIVRASALEPGPASVAVRDLIDRMMVTWQAACWEAVEADAPGDSGG